MNRLQNSIESLNPYKELVIFWFNNKNYWFGCTEEFDKIIINNYKNLLELQLYLNIEFYQNLDKDDLLGKIILLDQFSRHIYRYEKNKIKKFDNIALQLLYIYNLLINDKNFIEQFSPEERCFLIMPYRHSFEEKYLKQCIQFINSWKIDNYHPIYKKFYQATLKSLGMINNEKDMTYHNYKNINLSDIYSILDPNSIFELDRVLTFVNPEGVCERLYKEFVKNIINCGVHDSNKIYVSISGGVDSMVCLYLLYIYRRSLMKANELEIGAISINYNNRPEQDIELFMISEFCKHLGVNYYVREINEILRTRDCDREIYESITREIRFNAYKKMRCTIILGHNNDDCIENIFVNLKNKDKYHNLLGMEIKSKERDVTILRPLLHINKSDILEFAHQYNIPYTYDSTPQWSNRSKMRNMLLPSINNFDSEILPNLVTFIQNYNEIYKIYEKSIDKIDYYENYCIIDNSDGIIFFEYFKKIFIIICKKYKVKFVKNKSIEYLIECIRKDFKNKITLSKYLITQKIGGSIKVYIKESTQ
jgi:tRNA(Ile)-lysidine synthetase-like protein